MSNVSETIVFYNSGAKNLDAIHISNFKDQLMKIRICPDSPLTVCMPKADIGKEQGDVRIEDSCHDLMLQLRNSLGLE